MATTGAGTPYIESSDLVANYPAVSESLAERVDLVGVLPFADSTARGTALPTPTDGQYSYLQDTNSTEFWNGSAWVAVGTAPGLILIDAESPSGASSVIFDNVFTSTYENYLVVVDALVNTGSPFLQLRLRAGGSSISTTNYAFQIIVGTTTVSGGRLTGQTYFELTGLNTGSPSASKIDIFCPQAAKETGILAHSVMNYSSPEARISSGGFQLTTQVDGLEIYPATGTITGNIRVYGYKI